MIFHWVIGLSKMYLNHEKFILDRKHFLIFPAFPQELLEAQSIFIFIKISF